ncbi:hypothetical protein [Mycolicibacterium psychrotolerans]|uniref:Uncharacterized protein n=1 Tax=Mycolicibacterium psychrotolerans TaxID=216929 RepID=A0A7I7MBT3_9MYCO|nr:hypothetical protein [Mycolicibacterium psychrotolerans]BBX69724.1 hypothetical protein MPSYJ_31850 [Mycolicibacterium psychrotolerans]
MKLPSARSASCHFDSEHGEPVVPEEPGVIHAFLLDLDALTRTQQWVLNRNDVAFLDKPEESACGTRVSLVYPMPFNTDDPDVCPSCTTMATFWHTDREEFQVRVRLRHNRRVAREAERAAKAEKSTDLLKRSLKAGGLLPGDDESPDTSVHRAQSPRPDGFHQR